MVMIVDDDVDDSELVKEAFLRNDYNTDIVTAYNGQELMDNLHSPDKDNPQLILLDLNMPKKNGFQALKEIKSDASLSDIPVVILSASTSMEDELICRKLGCSLFIRKPTLLAEYDHIIQRIKGLLQ